jgi:hypothetical protein
LINLSSKNPHANAFCKVYTAKANEYYKSNMRIIQRHIDVMKEAGGIDWNSIYTSCAKFINSCVRDFLYSKRKAGCHEECFTKEEISIMVRNLVEHFKMKEQK